MSDTTTELRAQRKDYFANKAKFALEERERGREARYRAWMMEVLRGVAPEFGLPLGEGEEDEDGSLLEWRMDLLHSFVTGGALLPSRQLPWREFSSLLGEALGEH